MSYFSPLAQSNTLADKPQPVYSELGRTEPTFPEPARPSTAAASLLFENSTDYSFANAKFLTANLISGWTATSSKSGRHM